MDFDEIVDNFRLLYRNNFMRQTLQQRVVGACETIEAYYEGLDENGNHVEEGFKGYYIVVNYNGQTHPKIWACNLIQAGDIPKGVIHVNPELLKEPDDIRKMIFAHEYLEVMQLLDSHYNGKQLKPLSPGIANLTMFDCLKRRVFWQDSNDDLCKLHGALRQLLVSKGSLVRYLKSRFGLELKDFISKINDDPVEAANELRDIVRGFAGKHSVDIDLVYDRFQELFLDP